MLNSWFADEYAATHTGGTVMSATVAMLKINGLDLMFSQGEIRTLESASDVDGSAPKEKSVGWINYMQQRWPVYCLSEQLDLLISVPTSRRTCALLTLETGYIGMLCDDVSIMKQVTGQRHDIPLSMKTVDTPIQSLLVNDGRLLCVSGANQLAAYVEHLIHSV